MNVYPTKAHQFIKSAGRPRQYSHLVLPTIWLNKSSCPWATSLYSMDWNKIEPSMSVLLDKFWPNGIHSAISDPSGPTKHTKRFMTETYVFRTYLHRCKFPQLWLVVIYCGCAVKHLPSVQYGTYRVTEFPLKTTIEIYYRSRGHQPNIQSIQSIQSNV